MAIKTRHYTIGTCKRGANDDLIISPIASIDIVIKEVFNDVDFLQDIKTVLEKYSGKSLQIIERHDIG